MNYSQLLSLVILAVFASILGAAGQTLHGETAFVSAAANRSNPSPKDFSVYSFSKKLPQTYSGFAIEVASSNYPLRSDHPVFRQFGNIFYEKLKEGGYSYLITAEFSSEESALDFVTNMIVPRAKEARLFEYKEGTRKVVRYLK